VTLYRIGSTGLEAVPSTTYQAQEIFERRDLQKILIDKIGAIADGLMILSEEFGDWEDSRRRLDLLCVDRQARLVVVELKRTEGGGHIELQALRYAAMISRMTFQSAVAAHARYLAEKHIVGDAGEAILSHLQWEAEGDAKFPSGVKIFLVSADFSKEVTTTALWLREYEVDIRCIRIKPYLLEGQVLVDVEEIVPLKEAEEYMVRLREQETEVRQARAQGRDRTRFRLIIGEKVFPSVTKTRLLYEVVAEALRHGAKPRDILDGVRYWIVVDGHVDTVGFMVRAKESRLPESSTDFVEKFHTGDSELFHVNDKTYALTKKTNPKTEMEIQKIIDRFNLAGVSYRQIGDDEPMARIEGTA